MSSCPVRSEAYGGLPESGGLSRIMEYGIGLAECFEAAHCILGSLGRHLGKDHNDWPHMIMYESGHLREELGIIKKSMAEYKRDVYRRDMMEFSQYKPEYQEKMRDSARREVMSIREQCQKLSQVASSKGRAAVLGAREEGAPVEWTNTVGATYLFVKELAEAAIKAVADWPDDLGNPYTDSGALRALKLIDTHLDKLLKWGAVQRASKKAGDTCNPNAVSAVWVSPDGEGHRLSGVTHNEWATGYIVADPKLEAEWEDSPWAAGKFLLSKGWVRVSNFLALETTNRLPSDRAMKTTAEIVLSCALNRRDIEPNDWVYWDYGTRTRKTMLAQFLRDWGGDDFEIRFYEGLESRAASKKAKTFNVEVGTPVWMGKYKNKRGIVKKFTTNAKGDTIVFVDQVPNPTGKKKPKEMKLFKIRPRVEKKKASLSGKVTAWHCGGDIGSGQFSTKFLGTGEGAGMHALGPGIYFATNRGVAERYCKYNRSPVLYEVELDTRGFYSNTTGEPRALGEKLNAEIEAETARQGKTRSEVRGRSSLTYGPGGIGDLTFLLGKKRAAKRFVELGLRGTWEKIGAGLEIAVFDPRAIRVVGRPSELTTSKLAPLDGPERREFAREAENLAQVYGPTSGWGDWDYTTGIQGVVLSNASLLDLRSQLEKLMAQKGITGEVYFASSSDYFSDEPDRVKITISAQKEQRLASSQRVAARYLVAEDTAQLTMLSEVLAEFGDVIREATFTSYGFGRKRFTPEKQDEMMRTLRSSGKEVVRLASSLKIEDPRTEAMLKSFLRRNKNLVRMVQKIVDATSKDFESLMETLRSIETKSKSVYQKFWDYAHELQSVIKTFDADVEATIDAGGFHLVLYRMGLGNWTDESIGSLKWVMAQASKTVSKAGFPGAARGTVFCYPTARVPGRRAAVAWYRPTDDVMTVAAGSNVFQKQAPKDVLYTVVHELGHRVYFRFMGSQGRKAWEEFFEMGKDVPDVGKMISDWANWAEQKGDTEREVRHFRHFESYYWDLQKRDWTASQWLRIVVQSLDLAGGEKFDARHNRPTPSSEAALDELEKKAGEVRVFMKPVTAYSATSPEELFAEVFAHYVLMGPRTLAPIVRDALRRAVPQIKGAATSPERVARMHLAGLKFVDERSPRLPGARRFKITDPDAEPPGREDYLFKEKLRLHSERRPYKRLKKPVVDTAGVTDPGDVAYIDYSGGRGSLSIHLAIVRPGRRGQGLATKLLREFYKRMFPSGGIARWGRVLNPTAWALYEKMEAEHPDVLHTGSKFF